MPLPFENFSPFALNSKQKPSVKKPVDRASRKVDFEIYRSGRKHPDRFHL